MGGCALGPRSASRLKAPLFRLSHIVELHDDGIFPRKIPAGASPEIIAASPDGAIQPLVWLYEYKDAYQHPFFFRQPMELPAWTVIRGLPPGSEMLLIPGKPRNTKR